MPKLPSLLIALLFSLALAACRGATPGSVTGEPSLTSAAPPAQTLPVVTSSLPLISPPPATLTALPTPPPAPLQTATQMALQPCSPLKENSLTGLAEIVSAPYNPPPMGSDARHQGVDFSYYQRGERTSILGEGVQSVFSGRVAASISGSFPYGNVVIVETPATDLPPELREQLDMQEDQSLYSLYAHLGAEPLVAPGEAVSACQWIGEVGKSGNAGVAHLHLEMRIGPPDQQFPGMAYYSTQTTQEERDNYTRWRMSGEFQHFDPLTVLLPNHPN